MVRDFTRKELQGIRKKAVDNAEAVANNHWKRAYKQLADAVDRLDAMEARTEDRSEKIGDKADE